MWYFDNNSSWKLVHDNGITAWEYCGKIAFGLKLYAQSSFTYEGKRKIILKQRRMIFPFRESHKNFWIEVSQEEEKEKLDAYKVSN